METNESVGDMGNNGRAIELRPTDTVRRILAAAGVEVSDRDAY